MATYKAPLDDMRFVLNEVLNVASLSAIPTYAEVDVDTVNSMLETVGQFSETVLHPLNRTGDEEGCKHDRATKSVTTPQGFKSAYEQFCALGLTGLNCDPAYGGSGMPVVLGTALGEMFCSANMAFAMYPGLSHGAYNALHAYGSDALKQEYLPKLVTGEWSGTMCLTEPGAGTDLGLMKTKAAARNDESYSISGTKIFISAGEHDLTSNIIHLVLAKIDAADTPQGIKGVSLFLVPKFLPDGTRNPVTCGRIEEKMGIHGNSTCEMNFENAKGWLVGNPHEGMKAMFVMMNEARLGVGLQGLGLSELAYQSALAYATDRVQSAPIDAARGGRNAPPPASVTIIHHPDVRRELLTMKAQAEAGRMLSCWVAMEFDIMQHHPDDARRAAAKKTVDFLTPIVKAHLTDNAEANASGAMQVYGGHGYIREHGLEQILRDARITRLYEGTNGIQALDLIGRKVLMQNLLPAYARQVKTDIATARRNGVDAALVRPVLAALGALQSATRRFRLRGLAAQLMKKDTGPLMRDAGAVATDYLKLASLVAMGHMWVKMAGVASRKRAAGGGNAAFYETKLKTARFYMEKIMPEMHTHAARIVSGAPSLMDIDEAGFVHDQTTVGVK